MCPVPVIGGHKLLNEVFIHKDTDLLAVTTSLGNETF